MAFGTCQTCILFCFVFWPCHAACRILVPWPGIEPMPPAVEAQSLNHWTAREVPDLHFESPFCNFVAVGLWEICLASLSLFPKLQNRNGSDPWHDCCEHRMRGNTPGPAPDSWWAFWTCASPLLLSCSLGANSSATLTGGAYEKGICCSIASRGMFSGHINLGLNKKKK